MVSILTAFGPMRLALLALALLFAGFAPDKTTTAIIAWPQIVPTLLLPACAPLLMMVVLLDLIMARVMSADEPQVDEKKRLLRIMWTDLVVVIVLIVTWLPFFLSIGAVV